VRTRSQIGYKGGGSVAAAAAVEKKKMLDLVRGFYTALRFVTRMIRSAEFSDVQAV